MAATQDPGVKSGTVHVIGAGLAGLAAAVALTRRGRAVVLHDGARQAGGRCRSYHDATLDMMIDNGNHLLLSGNAEALDFLRVLGTADQLKGPPTADFPFVDIESGARWTVRPNSGRLPWWIFFKNRRVPGTKPGDYLALAKLLRADRTATIGELMACAGPLYQRLWQPLLLAALNTDPPESSAALAGAIIRDTLAKGGGACRPLIATEGLATAFVDPALTWLAAHGGLVRLDHSLRALSFEGDRVVGLQFADETVPLAAEDRVILAVPAPAAAALLPGLEVPRTFRSIVNAHFKMRPPPGLPPILGLINGTVEWIFAFPDRVSITISGADRLLDTPREALVQTLWSDVKRATGLADPLPPWQIIREKRATFAATPGEDARRPGTLTRFANVVLAGDWTATGLPATIEGSIRSGNKAAASLTPV
jgi:squalene-associated FAD-dependent desaturase